MSWAFGFLAIMLTLVAGVIVAVFGAIVLVKAFKLIGELIAHILRFILGMITDTLRAVGAVVLAIVLAPLILLNVVIGRWSASAHFGRAMKNEIKTIFVSFYRVAVGHPFRLIGLAGVTEGLEKRLPQVMADAPGADKPSKKRIGMFDGYTIIGSLPGGGSGGRLYIAEADELKLAGFARQGTPDVDQVVIKSFSLSDGSSLPQIVRESRALDAAKKLGLVLEHELTDERFFYVMPYVPGESLTAVTTRMHGLSPVEGLSDHYLSSALGYASGLLHTLNTYHRGGLWHKDVKPDNIIIDGHEAHLVDFGLVTPLRSAMTLTTHGTEYFRDPELVRQALRGVKVHQIDGTKFDIYAAGAVLFSVLENSFPAHGGLSQITKRCPDAVSWIVRRAMTDYDKRYESAAEMLADLEVVLAAKDPFKVRPADLPSMMGQAIDFEPAAPEPMFAAKAGTPTPPPLPFAHAQSPKEHDRPASVRAAGRPKLKVNHWWTGKYDMAGGQSVGAAVAASAAVASANIKYAKENLKRAVPRTPVPPEQRVKAADQVRSARARAAATRRAAQKRASTHRAGRKHRSNPTGINGGVAAGLVVAFLILAVFGAGVLMLFAGVSSRGVQILPNGSGITITRDGETTIYRGSPTPPSAPILATGIAETPELDSPPSVFGMDLSSLSGRTVLVVSDLGTPMDTEVKTQISMLLGGIEAADATVLGDGAVILDSLAGADDEANVELVASIEATRGQRPVDSSDFFPVMRQWLADHESVDMLLWLSPPGPGAEGIAYTVIAPQTMVSSRAEHDIGQTVARTLRSTAADF
jgi:serine/threonine protein kinase